MDDKYVSRLSFLVTIFCLVLAILLSLGEAMSQSRDLQMQIDVLETQVAVLERFVTINVEVYPPQDSNLTISFGHGEPERYPLGSLEGDENAIFRGWYDQRAVGATFYLLDKDGNILDSVDITNHVYIGETAYAWCATGDIGEDWWPEGLEEVESHRVIWFPVGDSCLTIAFGR